LQNTIAINIRIIVLIGIKEQCALYPQMLSSLAEESGTIIHIAEIADALAPPNTINNINRFIENLITFLIIIKIEI
jgi:hypothetical protein